MAFSGYNTQRITYIRIDANCLPLDLLRANCLTLVDADIGNVRVLRRHAPEGILDDNGGVMFIAHHFLEAACHY